MVEPTQAEKYSAPSSPMTREICRRIRRVVDFHVAGNDRIDEIIAVSVLQEHVAAPDVALIVDQIDHFAVCFCVIAVVVLVSDVLATTGGNACQEGNAVFPQADVCKLRIMGLVGCNDGCFHGCHKLQAVSSVEKYGL